MTDAINRQITISAPKERVFAALTDPAQLTSWFPDAVEGRIAPGETPVFAFGSDHKAQLLVVAVEPHDYFAYRWVPGGNPFEGDITTAATTLVEFRVTETDGSSTVTVTESGFAALPAAVAEQSLKQNTGGWEHMMARLERLFAA